MSNTIQLSTYNHPHINNDHSLFVTCHLADYESLTPSLRIKQLMGIEFVEIKYNKN